MPLDRTVLSADEPDTSQPRKLSASIESAVKAEGADHLAPIIDAIYGQETGHGKNSKTSIDGARGPMQIMPGTFKQLARGGESIDNETDNLRVGIRLIKTLGDRFNNDPARIAAGYFSGEGNVNPTGDQVIRADKADGNGKRVSAYVQDVLNRMVPSAIAGENGAAKAATGGESGLDIARQIAAGGWDGGVEIARQIASVGSESGVDIARQIAGGGGDAQLKVQKPGAPLDEADTALIRDKPAKEKTNTVPRRDELMVREMLAEAKPEELARLAGNGGLPGRVAQAMLAEGKAVKAPHLGAHNFRSFDELAGSLGYQELSPDQKDQVRQRWFAERIAPNLASDKQQAAWSRFEQKTRPGVVERIGSAIDKATEPGMLERAGADAKDIVGRLFGQRGRQEETIRKAFSQHSDEQLTRIASQGGIPAKEAQALLQERQGKGGSSIDQLKRAVRWREGEKFTAPEGVADATFSAGVPSAEELSQRNGQPLREEQLTPMQRYKNFEIDMARTRVEGMTPEQVQSKARNDKHFANVARLASERKIGPDPVFDKPHEAEPERPSLLKQGALNNPLTAIGETALNVASQGVAMPVAGIAGLVTEGARALGLTDKEGADVVREVGHALTYQPRGEMGRMTTEAVMFPFEKLAEAGQAAGGAVLDATGSPAVATAVDTAVNAVPMLLGAGKGKGPKIAGREAAVYSDQGLQILAKAHPDKTVQALAEMELRNREHGRIASAPAGTEAAVPEYPPVAPPPEAAPPAGAIAPERPVTDSPHPAAPEPRLPIVGDRLSEFASQVDPVSLPEAEQLVAQARAAGSDNLAVFEHPGGGYLAAPREWAPERASNVRPEQFETTPQRNEPRRALDAAESPVRVDQAPPEMINGIDPHAPGKAVAPMPLPPEVWHPEQAMPKAEVLAESFDTVRPHGAEMPKEPSLPEVMRQPKAVPVEVPDVLPPESGSLAKAEQAMAPGANHVGLIDDAKLAGTAERRQGEPLRREDILSDLVKALDATIYEGRVKRKGVLGLYTPKKETVRIKRAADIEVAAHEIAHLLDDRIPLIKETYKNNKEFAKELRGVSYDKAKVHEGFAEFVRLYMTQPEQALAKAPEFSKWFADLVERHPYGQAIKKAQGDMTAWFGQDALDRARSKIGMNKTINDAFDRMSDKFRQSVIDDLHGVYRMERDLKGKIEPGGAYETARLSRASHSIAEGAINYGHPVRKVSGDVTFAGKGLREILEPIADKLDDSLLYFVGRSAEELMWQGREHLFTKAEIRSMVELRTPERAEAFKQYQEWNRGVVEFAEQLGVINPASRKLWQRQNYMPFHRVGQPGGFSAKPGDWSGVKALTGGTENLRSILGNMTSNAAMLIDKALKNEARVKVAELAEKERGAGKFMTRIDPESRPVHVDKAQVLKAVLESMGIDRKDPKMVDFIKDLEAQIESSPGMFELMVHNQAPAGSNVVAVLKHGKPIYYEIADQVLRRALTAVDRPAQSWLVKMLGLPKRVGQTATTLTPDFMVANIARDTLMGAVMSRAGFRPVMDSLEGMRLRVTNDPLYQEYIANGGGLSSIYLDEGKLRARLEKFYQKQGVDYRTVLDAPDKLLGFVETLADAFETSTRLGEYKRAREGGQHPRHAAYLAREVSTDFAMRGDNQAVNFMYDTVMFLKPAVLSFDRLARGLMHDPNRTAIAAKAGMVGLFSVGLALLNSEDERYQDLPDWDRDTHWHFFVGDQHFRYPKIWEIGAMASVAERALEKTVESDPGGLGKDIVRIIGQTFNLNLMPQVLAPIYEQATNRNSFTKAMIETPGMESQQPFMRAKASTSQTMQAAGMATRNLPEALQVNPVRTEALLRGYLSTWAMYGLMLSDKAFFSDEMPAGRTDQLPVVRRFYSEEPPLHTKYEQQYYDMLGESRRLFGTMKELYKDGRTDLAQEYRDDPKLKEYGPLEGTSKVLQVINMRMRNIRRDESLDPDQKREALDEWTAKRNEVLKQTVGKVREVRGGD